MTTARNLTLIAGATAAAATVAASAGRRPATPADLPPAGKNIKPKPGLFARIGQSMKIEGFYLGLAALVFAGAVAAAAGGVAILIKLDGIQAKNVQVQEIAEYRYGLDITEDQAWALLDGKQAAVTVADGRVIQVSANRTGDGEFHFFDSGNVELPVTE